MEDETTPHHNDDLNGDDTGMGTLANRDDTGMGTLANRDDTGMGTLANRDDTGMGTLANGDNGSMATIVSSTVNQPSSLRKDPIKTNKILSIFKRRGSGNNGLGNKPAVTMVASQSTTGLIFEGRPKGLPAKTPSEEKKHQKLYQDMLSSVKKKEMKQAEASIKLQQKRQSKEDLIANDQRKWSEILPKFESLRQSKEVKDIWWHGLPPGVRGEVWKKALGNDLNISPELYKICLKRCTERLELAEQRVRSDSVASITSISRENSVEVIHLDVLRTFPTLGFFQKGGPYHNTLHDILGAYACYRPDVGYVQGMSFIAAVLLLNMDTSDAFIALSNLLNRSSYLAFFRVDQDLMKPYFNVFSSLLEQSLPKISTHFTQLSFYPQFYLMEWIFTIYTRVLPLDIACRVWDLFCRDGDVFLYRTALGILNLYQSNILELTTIADVGQFLGHLPSDLDSDSLFNSIANITLSDKKFNSMLLQYKRL
jgi:hypothetical protein